MKLIATDLDGTLLNSKHQVSSENENALRQAQRDGIEVVVSTGRAYFDVVSIFEPLGIKTWVISANGAVIHDPDGRLYHSETIDKKRAYDILSWLESENYYYEVFTDSAIYTPQNGRQLLDVELDRVKSANPKADLSVLMQAAEVQYSQSGFAYIDTFQELFEEDKQIDFYNILGFSFFKEKLEAGWQRYQEDKDLTLVSSADHNFELSSKKASKGQALERLAKRLNIPMKETAAVGDSLNDRSMLEAAGKGVAMGNAREDIKAIADAVTLTNDEHGVAHMIRHLL
ncbi:Cof-type HAD-IIB family hydrolase [Bacillus halotolerans]|uniref:Cof-type HAD-IIB family hydrolase n=1 Tax=Bacillus halotolerans TaxID=260554 RepID=UPI000FD85B3C|nr:Cof-type HAD-IIB family hydrolase [Bacillus halotolerans]AZV49810.1 Cof-type HAD-IIB family hydrolase [Bacillus halotolerans]MCP9297800.1 Cof-type HAD-IIB family hydrolase [Bacillus halotolerans]UTL76295.1 Cof-type HAD-IIB family hydrolase [Bacillus halotolerans]WHY24082.1 Cof-type HAD-IIB family hydrolase [Bacillus halotolerans]WJE42711.1 Cof-type HAD-IIB family hydrolase [Bacillus halotolerans]